MNSKIKAMFAVVIMVAAAIVVFAPNTNEEGTDAAIWANNSSYTVHSGYAFSYKVVLPMSSATFIVAATVGEAPDIADATGDDVTGFVAKDSNGNPITDANFDTAIPSGATISCTILKNVVLSFTSSYNVDGVVTGAGTPMTITFTVVDDNANPFADSVEALNLFVGAEVRYDGFKAEDIDSGLDFVYSAEGLPYGLTMEREGLIYGSPTAATDVAKKVTLYAYEIGSMVYSSIALYVNVAAEPGVKILNVYADGVSYTNIDDESLEVTPDGDNVYKYAYVKSDVNNLKFELNDAVSGTERVVSIVGADKPYGAVINDDKDLLIGDLDNIKGEVNIQLKVVDTVSNSTDTFTSYVMVSFYVIPVNEFLTAPEANMEISYA